MKLLFFLFQQVSTDNIISLRANYIVRMRNRSLEFCFEIYMLIRFLFCMWTSKRYIENSIF